MEKQLRNWKLEQERRQAGKTGTTGAIHRKRQTKQTVSIRKKEIQTTRTYEYDDNFRELTRCTEKAEGGKKTVHNYTYDKIGNRTSYEKIEVMVSAKQNITISTTIPTSSSNAHQCKDLGRSGNNLQL